MEKEVVKVSQVKVNNENPRSITTEKFAKLVNSILVFPKMLNIRHVVVDNRMCALGGNMRIQALKAISKMKADEIMNRLFSINDFLKKSEGERNTLCEYWKEWLKNPTVEIINTKNLTEDERKQFVIKDNVSFGTWDYDALANKWDNGSLGDWGIDVWGEVPTSFAPMAPSTNQQAYVPNEPDPSEEDNPNAQFQDALPPELQGIDLSPDKLPEIKGSDKTAMERVIIVYPKERLNEVLNLLGMTALEKVVYRLEEILPEIKE